MHSPPVVPGTVQCHLSVRVALMAPISSHPLGSSITLCFCFYSTLCHECLGTYDGEEAYGITHAGSPQRPVILSGKGNQILALICCP